MNQVGWERDTNNTVISNIAHDIDIYVSLFNGKAVLPAEDRGVVQIQA